jgi:hypothetical protein
MKVYCAIIKDVDGKLMAVEPILSESKLNVYKKLKDHIKTLRQIISVEAVENVITIK